MRPDVRSNVESNSLIENSKSNSDILLKRFYIKFHFIIQYMQDVSWYLKQ